jgi:hypothetical protein
MFKTKTLVDDETQARIQDFVSWASKRGFHVIGGLISKEPSVVRTFATGPEGSLDAQEDHIQTLVGILYQSVMKGRRGGAISMPLGEV